MSVERDRKGQEREKLKNIILQWNANRLDLFALSEPNDELEFHGVMRFYFQDAGQKVATKCIRVSSTASTQDCIETLIEKFRPDIRMLSVPEYALYEIHENGDERKLNEEEKPLLVQLNWHKDDREGRFLLRRMDEKSYLPSIPEANSFKRKLSKREKKEKKRREKKERVKISEENKTDGIAERLYSELPETSFTRSISNPEAVMRRRRQQKLEKKLQQFRQEGGTDAGGTLRIFGENLNKDVPYKTLLLSTKDTAAYVVKEILEKYGHDKEDPTQYCLVQAIIPASSLGCEEELQEYHSSIPGVREYILDDDDCPLAIERQHNRSKGILVFHVKRRPADYQLRKRKKKPKPAKGEVDGGYRYEDLERLPYLLELNPDGSDIHGTPKKHRLYLNVTEVGSERSSSTGGQCLQLFGPNVQPRHCVIAHTESIITVTPSSRDAETYVNGARIYETTILQHGVVVRFGKLHTFRFVDPIHEQKRSTNTELRQTADFLERNARKDDQLSIHHGGYETTFDADGNVETVSTHSKDDRMSRKSDDAYSHRSLGRESSQGHGSYEKFDQRCGNDPIMPALLEFWEEGEDAFLSAIITQLDPSQVQFKVAPTYTLYMAARYRASTHFRPETTPSDRAHRLTALMNKVSSMIHQVIQDRYREAGSLAFWLANASELLHFLKQDRHLSAYTLDAQDMLAESVQLAFRSLVTCQQGELLAAMPAFLEDRDDVSEEEGTTAAVLTVLSSAMSLLRRCRVNAALTIQLFSQLFHYINMWLFNQVVSDSRPNLCTRLWGVRFKRRLARIESWAEKQGLELAADCHLSRIIQAAHLLQAPKSSPDDIASISSSCFKLNSLQLFTLLERYRPVPDEPRIPRDLIESVVKVAENTADELARSDGREIKLDEDADLQLPFLLPEDGYSCDIVRGVPTGLQDFLQSFVQAGLCHLSIQTSSSGYWTIYMSDQDIGHLPPRACSPSVHSHAGDGEGSGRGSALPPEPEVSTIRLQKSNNGIGLSIVAAGGVDQDKLGIYVKSVVKGGAADLDGRLQAGDQLLKVDGQSLVGISQEKAAELMTRTGPVVTLEVAKQGAIYHGLQALLSKPSPVMPRGGHRMSERDIPSRVMHDPSYDPRFLGVTGARIQSSKSVPSLNSGHSTQETVRQANNNNSRSHEVYNPSYSRTSSTTSIPKATEFSGPVPSDSASRSKSANNLRQEALPPSDRYPYVPSGQCPPPAYSAAVGPLGNRPTSQPNLQHQQQQQAIQEERHYQNISMYKQTNNHSLPRPAPQQYPQHQQSHGKTIHGSHSSLNRPEHQQLSAQSSLERSRPLSTLVSPREQEQYVNSLGYIHSSSSTLPPPPPSPHRTQSGHTGTDFRPPLQGHGQRTPDGREFHNHPEHLINEVIPENYSVEDHYQRGFPSNYSHSHSQFQHADPRQRDIIRQEAKMEEMREEVRRREERERLQQPNQVWPSMRSPQPGASTQPNRQIPPSYNAPGPYSSPGTTHNTRNLSSSAPPPTLKPRPHPGSEKLQRQYGHNNRYECTPEGHMAFQDPAAAPLLSNANPLIASHQRAPPPAVSYRFGPSGYPPRLADGQQNSGRPPVQSDPRQASHFPKQSMNQSAQGQRQVAFDNLRSPVSGHPGSQDKKDMSTLASPSPWEREEKEKLQKQRLEEARHVRDEEIRELENLQRRNPKQEERLRTLRLEKEFQRRAEELHGDEEEEDDEELLDRAENRERMLKMQEDLERARQRRLEWEQEQHQKHAVLTSQEEWKRHQQDRQHSQIEEQEGRLKQLRLEEVNRKKELEAAKEVEEQLLREARRRQDEENRVQRTLQQQQQQRHNNPNVPPPYGSQTSVNAPPRPELIVNNQHDIPPPLPTSPPPVEPGYTNHFNQTNATHEITHPQYSHSRSSGSQRLDTLLLATSAPKSQSLQQNSVYSDKVLGPPPAPPERKSSYEVTNHMTSNTRLTNTSSLRNGDGGSHPHQPKKVSFHDSQLETEVTYDANGNHDLDENNVQLVVPSSQTQMNYTSNSSSQSYTLQDIDEVLATPHNSQNLNTYSAGSTPGVIGAQEIYRDPRQRIEAERLQHHFEYGKSTGPEKLTFREKMKMFAMETGQQESPKDKVKISRAQRDIETNMNGT